MKKRAWMRGLPLLLAAILSLSACETHSHTYTQTVIAPTCSSLGYTIHSCACGDRYFSDYQAESAHSFGGWIAGKEATLTSGGEEYRICKNCGALETHDIENTSVLPKLYWDSDGTFLYSAGELRFTCKAVLNAISEGVKPVYDLTLLSIENTKAAYPVDLGWGEQSHYRLDPCASDPTLSRASAAEALWLACVASREEAGLTPEWARTAQYGNFPVQVYKDDVYMGVYLLTPPEGDWKYAYEGDHGSPTAAIRAEDESKGCLFTVKPSYTDTEDSFTVLYSSTADVSWATESFDGFSIFVQESRDAAFKEQLSQYTDTTVLMDHFLLCYFFGLTSGDTAGTVWSTSDGVHWIPSFSSLSEISAIYGIKGNGTLTIPVPTEDGSILYTGGNLLWARLCTVFGDELRERYAVLRESVLNPDALYQAFLTQYRRIEPELFATEEMLYPSLANDGSQIANIFTFLRNRCTAMDNWLYYTAET